MGSRLIKVNCEILEHLIKVSDSCESYDAIVDSFDFEWQANYHLAQRAQEYKRAEFKVTHNEDGFTASKGEWSITYSHIDTTEESN